MPIIFAVALIVAAFIIFTVVATTNSLWQHFYLELNEAPVTSYSPPVVARP